MLKILPATPVDHDAVWEMFHHVVGQGETFVYAPDSTREFFNDLWLKAPIATFVAKEGDKVVGTYVLRENKPGLGNHMANAGYITHPDYRGKGIAQAMCKHSLEEAKKLGFKAMQFNFVVATNERAVRLWQYMGFTIVGTVPEAYQHQKLGKLVDVHTMWRAL